MVATTMLLTRAARAAALTLAASAVTLAAGAATVAAAATPNSNGATLSVQSAGAAAAPQVRSVQRDASDNEQVTAGAAETVEVLLADGTSVTLSPGSRIVLERYRYDRGSRTGELQLRVDSGAVRIVGGVLNNSSAVVVKTPSGAATLDNAVAYVQVKETGSEFALVAGRAIIVQGTVENVTLSKSGSAAALDGAGVFVGATRTLSRAELQAYSNLVNPGLASGVVPTFVVDNRAPASAVVMSADAAAGEDTSAKDDKLGPQLPDPIAPAGACSAGGCSAGAPVFDLSSSIGDVVNRQVGRTPGAVWQRQYVQGDAVAVAPNRLIRGFAPDFSSAGDGQRTTTARIFAANSASPFSLTFGAANPAMSASDFAVLTCFESTSGGCQASPIVNLYIGADGLVYRVAGLSGGFPAGLATDMFLTFRGGMTTGDFGAYPIATAIPIDYAQPGVVTSRPVNDTVTRCVQNEDTSCTRTYASDQERADAVNVSGFFRDFQAQATLSSHLGLFSQYFVGVELSEEAAGGGGTNYLATVVFSGQTAYDVSSLQAGFQRIPIRNYESSMNTICFDGSFDCDDLARDLFGEQFPGDPFSPPAINTDLSDPFFNPNFPTYPEVTADVVVRDLDSFLAVDVISRLPGDNQRLFYATGSVSGRLPTGAAALSGTLDTFRLSAGLDAAVSGGRAFLRPDTLLGIAPAALLSSGLRVLNAPYATTINTPSRALHYDFAAAGNDVGQTSTISVTLGTLAYSQASNSAQFSGRTVGSTARSGASRYSGSVQSALLSTATGGGNPNIANTGRAGYLVLENYDPVSAPNGGLERTIENGTATQTQYANLRLAQIQAGGSQAAPANRVDQALTGYSAGFAEVTAAGGGSVELAPLISQSFLLSTNAAQGTMGAAFAANVGTETATLNFGSLAGASGLSAYTGAKEFAAMTASTPNLAAGAVADATSANAAIVSGAPLVGSTSSQGWTAALDDATRARMSTNAANTSGYRHLQWGFFFGDFSTSGGRAAHAHLTSWVAGRATPEGTPLPGGTADYAGHVFANVSNGDQLYSATGTFANQWNFATRSGNGTMSFDGDDYSFVTRLLGLQRMGSQITSTSTARFEGLISTSDDAGYIGSLNGTFAADPAATTDPLALRSGVMGQFTLSRTRDGNPYRAVGTFAGERQGQ